MINLHKNSKTAIILPIAVAAAVVAGLVIGYIIGNINRPNRSVVGVDKLSYTLALIDQQYVDSVDLDTIYEQVIPLILDRLDPHSVYIPVSSMSRANDALEGEFDGIGVVFNMATDTVVVLNVIPSGPSDKAGVRNGDRIISINDSTVAGKKIPQDNIVKMLRGKRGTKVRLSLQRGGLSSLVPVTVERGIIPIKSIDAAFMIAPDCGFVKLSAFSRNSYRELLDALTVMKKAGMKRLIFDLRGNAGGFMDQAIMIANEFLAKGDLIVYTEDRNKTQAKEYGDGNGNFIGLPMTILIDEGSASSSEILAGAIQDNDRGTIIGRRSFGKGLVQRQFTYPDGSAIRLTMARYYTPAGRSIQKPYGDGQEDYYEDIIKRFRHKEFFSADSIKFADSLKFTTKSGRVVYGGGGIMPDIFVPMDTTDVTHYFMEVVDRNILYRYTMNYADRHRAAINKIKSLKELDAFLNRDRNLLENFVAYAASQGVAPNRREIDISKKILIAQLRAYIGRNTPLEDVGFYGNIYKIDNVILRALAMVFSLEYT